MNIIVTPQNILRAAAIFSQMLARHGFDAGLGHALLEKLLGEFGQGLVSVDARGIFHRHALVVHRDDVRTYVRGVELEVKVGVEEKPAERPRPTVVTDPAPKPVPVAPRPAMAPPAKVQPDPKKKGKDDQKSKAKKNDKKGGR